MFIHRSLFIDELIRHVINYLMAENAKRSVAHLGMTCKSLLEPCLDVMWNKIDSLNPLMSTFPAEVWLFDQGFVSRCTLRIRIPCIQF